MKLSLFIIFMIGAGLLTYSLSIPMWKDEGTKTEWDNKAAENIGNKNRKEFEKDYYKNVGPLYTGKIRRMDLEFGLMSFSVSLSVTAVLLGLKNLKDFSSISTPKKKFTLFILANVGWLLLIPSGFVYYTFREQRGDYPWFADSIGIPIYSGTALILLTLPLVNLYFGVFAYFAEYPAMLMCWHNRFDWKTILIELFFVLFGILNLFVVVEFLLDGDFLSLPISILFFYLLLSTRAGFIKRMNAKYSAHVLSKP